MTMTVAELIVKLQTLDQHLLVKIPYYDMGYEGDPDVVVSDKWCEYPEYKDHEGPVILIFSNVDHT